MHSELLPIHLSFAGIWLGCVITEALFERALLGKGRVQELILVELHKRVDFIVEVPAFVIVLITGALMYQQAAANRLLDIKIAFGLLAIAVNIYCVWLVLRRAAVAKAGDWDEFSRLDHKQHQYGTVVLVAIILALLLGVYVYGNA